VLDWHAFGIHAGWFTLDTHFGHLLLSDGSAFDGHSLTSTLSVWLDS
jgi:hypothetical protein